MATTAPVVTGFQSALVTLGRFELSVGDRSARQPPTHKARAVVAFLVANRGRDVARERLLELFWSEFELERAREGLRTALSSVRHALRTAKQDADALLFADKSVVRWTGDTAYDVACFEEFAQGTEDRQKRAALTIYGGDFLEGTYEDWVVGERERIATVYEAVLADLIAGSQDVDAARLLLARNPFHEEAYATLIHAQLEANRPAAAAKLIAQYRAAMGEISSEPSLEFSQRFAHVQDTVTIERAARHVGDAHDTRGPAPPPKINLPLQITSFIGRSQDLALVNDLLRRTRLVTLAGAGGIGKTRLAIEAASKACGMFDDGVWFIDLASVSDPHYVVSAIASVIGVTSESLERSMQDAVVAALQTRRALIVLDNCEHVVAAAARISEGVLRKCANVTILATSREPLGVAGEEVVRLSALSQADAVELFTQRAKAAEKQFTLSDSNTVIVNAICRRLEGIPLAIELAAPRVSALSLKRLQSELEDHFRILTSGSATALPRHKTVRALIDWSYDLLTSSEQTMLRHTGVFIGGFTLAAAEAVLCAECPERTVLDIVSSLVTKSLVILEPEPEPGRYRLLQTTQIYAGDKLRECGELATIREAHAQYFLRLMHEADLAYGASNARDWLQRYQPEVDNVRAAIDHCFDAGNVLVGASLITASRELWQEAGLHAEAMHRAQHALQLLPEDAPLALRAGLWLVVAQVSNTLYLTPQALDAAQKARNAFETLGDRRSLASALQSAGFALMRAGIHEDGEAELQRAQDLAEQQGNRRLVMRSLLRRAQNIYTGRTDAHSLPMYEKALQLARALQDDLYEGYIVGHMAEAYFVLNDPAHSVSLAAAAVEIFERRNDPAKESNSLANLAAYHLVLGELEAARDCARRAIVRAREAESPVHGVAAIQHVAALAAIQGQLQASAHLIGFADEAFTSLYFSRSYTECETRERAMKSLKEQLPADDLQALLKEGAALSEADAFALALSL